jgi:hypothetical protein
MIDTTLGFQEVEKPFTAHNQNKQNHRQFRYVAPQREVKYCMLHLIWRWIMKRYIWVVILMTSLLIACTPSEGAIQTALKETEAAKPTGTFTPVMTDTPVPTDTTVPTDTPKPTNTPTNSPVPTHTPTFTPTTNPLSKIETLAKIVLQVADLEEFYLSIGRDLYFYEFNVADPYMTHWSAPIPSSIVQSYSTAYDTRRVDGDMAPKLSAFHNTAIYIFPDSESAHAFFIEDTQSMSQNLKLDIQTIGDESVAFSGRLKDNRWPIGGVIWRYKQAYVFVSAQLFFQVTAESIETIALNIHNRLVEVMD